MRKYDNFFLPAADLTKGKEFYQDVLGMSVKFDFPEKKMIAFQVGDEEPAIILNANPEFKPTIWFVVDDVKQKFTKLTVQGVQFVTEPFPINTGWAAEFVDPFGNRLGITDYKK